MRTFLAGFIMPVLLKPDILPTFIGIRFSNKLRFQFLFVFNFLWREQAGLRRGAFNGPFWRGWRRWSWLDLRRGLRGWRFFFAASAAPDSQVFYKVPDTLTDRLKESIHCLRPPIATPLEAFQGIVFEPDPLSERVRLVVLTEIPCGLVD